MVERIQVIVDEVHHSSEERERLNVWVIDTGTELMLKLPECINATPESIATGLRNYIYYIKEFPEDFVGADIDALVRLAARGAMCVPGLKSREF